MSPQIRINGELVADVPDETGLYQALDGNTLWIDLSGIEARNSRQTVILEGSTIGGQRIVGLTHEGKGNSSDRKRGDDKEPTLEVILQDRPIRVSYQDKYWSEPASKWGMWGKGRLGHWEYPRRTYHNPKWIRR